MDEIVIMPNYSQGRNALQRAADSALGIPQRTTNTVAATPQVINPENVVSRERVFSVNLVTSNAATKTYVIFDGIGLVENNNGTPLTAAGMDAGSTYGSADVAPILKAMSFVPFRLERLRVTLPASETQFPGRIQLVKTDFTGSLDPIPVDEAANSNPFYDQGNILDFNGLGFLIDPYRGIRVDLDQTTSALTIKFTFYVSQIANNYLMKTL